MKKIKPILFKEQVIRSIRNFFQDRGFHEVEIPIFHTSLPLEPNIYAFKFGKYYLPTSPEATLKKAIAQGIGNCFAVGHTFRDMEGTSPIHRPEFLMLEWYREDADYRKIIEETQELILYVERHIHPRKVSPCEAKVRDDIGGKWPVFSMVNLFEKYAKMDLEENIDDQKMERAAKDKGYGIKGKSWEQIFNQIFLNEIEPYLPKEPFFLVDYPSRISPLCKKREDKPYLAERFELYINGIEIANGNSENTDSEGILRRMKREEKYRKKMGILSPPIDMEFIGALKKMQKKNYAGIGLGVERLTLILSGLKDIRDLDMSSLT